MTTWKNPTLNKEKWDLQGIHYFFYFDSKTEIVGACKTASLRQL